MDVIRHDRPSVQTIAVAIEGEEGLLDDFRDIRPA